MSEFSNLNADAGNESSSENLGKLEKIEEDEGAQEVTNKTETTFCGSCTVVTEKTEAAGDEEIYIPPYDRFVIPSDVVEIRPEDESVFVVGTRDEKVTRIAGLDHMTSLKDLILRSCLISRMDGAENLLTLRKLELYDNQIEEIIPLERLTSLTILDISFNAIREMSPVASCPHLQELYIAQNKLRKIEGLEGLVHLRILDLGANRIKVMEGLENLTSLESLWLGKNKITEITGIDHLPKLRQLDIQNNRLRSLGDGISGLTCLEELYLACNALENIDGLPTQSPLNTCDLSTNSISSINGIEQHKSLKELWMTSSKLSSFDQLSALAQLPELECLYLEHSPIASDFEYRKKLTLLIPSLIQLDANMVTRWS